MAERLPEPFAQPSRLFGLAPAQSREPSGVLRTLFTNVSRNTSTGRKRMPTATVIR